jgi:SAM-dependent methyltransferase
LDFGCGTGDFSKLLLSLGFRVCGYDPFVKPKIRSRDFVYASEYDQIPFRNHTADLALAVTTLDHILDEQDLQEALTVIRSCLKQGAPFYMIEYALDSAHERSKYALSNDYQAFRTSFNWAALLKQTSFDVLDITQVSHPLISPSTGYIAFSRKLLVRFRRRFPTLPLARVWYDPILGRQAARLLQKVSPSSLSNGSSPLKLIHSQAN